jgi:predicted double-glycine peptidase
MRGFVVLLKAGTVALFLLGSSGAYAQGISLAVGGQRLTKDVKSWKDLRREGVVLQELDYSCGAAAMSTLLSHHFGDPVNEGEVIGFIFIHGQTPEEGLKKYFQRQGFSLLDLKRFAEFRGYKVAGYREMDFSDLLEFLEKDRLPVLVPINTFGYSHFVIVRGIEGNRVYLADPAFGKTTMTIARFASVWVDGIGLIVSRGQLARRNGRPIPQDRQLDEITAAGAGSVPSGGGSGSKSPLMTIGVEEGVFPDRSRFIQAFQNLESAINQAPHRIIGGVTSNVGAAFELPNYNPVLQFGRPAGNFIDFTPPSGRIIIQPPPEPAAQP